MKANRPLFYSAFAASIRLLARRPHKAGPTLLPSNLATFHPAIASSWVAATSNKLLQPQHVLPTSRKLAWWRCRSCGHEHNKRIDHHVAAGGVCPKCGAMPTSPRGRSAAALDVPVIKHRCRPDSSLSTLAAPNANRVRSSIADDGYLRTLETRNLQPMLARNYEKEVDTIGDDDILFVSPKLDGVRCVVAWNARERRPFFFSRSGTLFECCDAFIEPALRPLFEKDPTLVLDGELYNHNVNDFEHLISAIRTTRDRLTPAIAKLQERLQYHAFDVLYASELPDMTKVPFSERYKHLCKLFNTNIKCERRCGQNAALLVPAFLVTKAEIPHAFGLSIRDGYEGIIVRRDGATSARRSRKSSKTATDVTNTASNDGAVVGYAYGARSSNLLKYKVMQDDEYLIVSGVEGRGKWKGRLGAFVCRTQCGQMFTVTPATTEENKRDMWRRLEEYKGKMLTVQYQQLSANGVPRFPIGKYVRGSKNGEDWI